MTDFFFPISVDKLRAALVCVSTEETRYYLRGVAIQPVHRTGQFNIVSTDGHRLFVGIDQFERSAEYSLPKDNLIIPTETVKKALTGYKAETIYLQFTGDRYLLGDLAFEPVDGVFPQWQRTFPSMSTMQNEGGTIAQFDPKYMADLDKMGTALGTGGRKGRIVPVISHMGNNPAVITFPGRYDCVALVMPRRGEAPSGSDLSVLLSAVVPDPENKNQSAA